MNRTPFVGGNVKNNVNQSQLETLISAIHPSNASVECVYYVPDLYLASMKKHFAKVGAQDIAERAESADTHSAATQNMLKEFAVEEVIIGHSDNRKLSIDKEEFSRKVEFNKDSCIRINFCCGESQAERDANQTQQIINEHIMQLINGKPNWDYVVISYEPVWAIGTGKVATPADAEDACKYIRSILKEKVSSEVSEKVRILYGGSVKAASAPELIAQPNIDGFLVGGACLDAGEFKKIIDACA